jgi:hypothetical protein
MKVLDPPDSLFVKVLLVGRGVEVKVTAKDLVGSFAGQDHLDTHGLDLSGKKVHGCGCADSRDVVCLEVIDDVLDCVETFLNGEGVFVVHGAQKVGRRARRDEVGGTGQADGERVKPRPGGESRCLV